MNKQKINPDVNNIYKDLPLPPDINRQVPNVPLSATKIETPHPAVKKGSPWMRDLLGIGVFIIAVSIGTFMINTFIFRSFNTVGPSMEPTLSGGVDGSSNDRLIVNRMPVTIANITGNQYVPSRGEIIVFKNPHWVAGDEDEYIVKRVVGLPGEKVVVNDCVLKIINSENPDGFNPYKDFKNLASNDGDYNKCVAGDGTDVTVPDGEIFVVGDHREGSYSMDSRNGDGRSTLGTIPLEDVIGPVSLRVWPLSEMKSF